MIEFATGFATGIHLPTQQLIVGECTSPKHRSGFAVLCYLLFLLGHLLSHALSHYHTVAIPGLCILNVVILSAHLVAVGFLHPESPRYLLSVRGKIFLKEYRDILFHNECNNDINEHTKTFLAYLHVSTNIFFFTKTLIMTKIIFR